MQAKEITITQEEIEARRKKAGANLPVTTMKMGKMVDAYWDEIRRAPEEGKKVAWMVNGIGTILTYAAGMPTLFHASYAPYCTSRREEGPILELANQDYGFLPDTCSYIRLHAEIARLQETGQIEKIRQEYRMPKPDLVVCGRGCTEHSTLAELVARTFNVPIVIYEGIHEECKTPEDYRRHAKYMEGQIKDDIIPAIEQVTGRPYPYDKLSEMVAFLKETATMRNEILELMKNKPSPCSMFDLGISIGSLIAQIGRPETAAYYREFVAEMKERVAKGIGVVSPEKYRLYWDGYSTWSILGAVMRELAPNGGIPLVGRYIWGFWRNPELLDPNEPIASMARCMGRQPITYPPYAKNLIMDLIEQWKLDGLIMTSFVTCRMWNVGQHEFAEEAERRFGIPSLIFQCDMVDRTHINYANLTTRLQAFMEMIEARRARFRG